MARFLLSGGSEQTSIVVQTRLGTDIGNSQSHEFSFLEKSQFPNYQKNFPTVRFRTGPNPIYNCHGMVFASRRTGIHDSRELQCILHEDGYTEVAKNSVLPGDIIVYYDEVGDFEHSGLIVEWNEQLKIPLVVSKWGKYSEAIHWGNDSPYFFGNVRYYRLTKWN